MGRLASAVIVLGMIGCQGASPPPRAAKAPHAAVTSPALAAPAPKDPSQWNVVDVALSSKDHTTLVAAVKAADLVESLSSPGGVYTVFAPTNAAFDKLPAGTVEGLLAPARLGELKTILQHHAAVPILKTAEMKDGQTMSMADGTRVTFHVKDGKVMVDDAHILASISATNGIVHVIDTVLVPAAK